VSDLPELLKSSERKGIWNSGTQEAEKKVPRGVPWIIPDFA
jgi:hypothetical protein